MKLKKLNKVSNVCHVGNASWQMVFETDEGYAQAILQLSEMYGVGHPYRNDRVKDSNKSWMFRSAGCDYNTGSHQHKIYLTTEDQITFCKLAFNEND